MKKLLLCFLSMGIASGSARAGEFGPEGCLRRLPLPFVEPAFPSPDYYRKMAKGGREIRGVLETHALPSARRPFPTHYIEYLMNGLDGAISVDGKLYALDFGGNVELREQARRLAGKRVTLRGQNEVRHLPFHPTPDGGKPAFQAVEYVLVSSVEEVDEFIREVTEVDVQGRYDEDYLLGYDGTTGQVVHVNGQTFVLDLGKICHPLSRARWTGKTVRIQGRLGEWRTYVGPMEPAGKSPRYRVLHVTSIGVVPAEHYRETVSVEVQGLLQMAPGLEDPCDIFPPRQTLQVNVHGRVLTLSIPGGQYRRAQDMVGWTVTIRGRLVGDMVEVTDIQPVAPPALPPVC